MRRRVLPLVAFVALLGLLTVPGPSAGAGPSPLGFTTGFTFLPLSDGGNEPSIAIDQHGVRYVSWQGPGEFAVSRNGIKWTNTGIPDPDAIGDVTNAVDASGAVYNGQICGDLFSLHTCIYRSVDGTRSWQFKTEPADSHPGASDRPWIDVYPRVGPETRDPDKTRVYVEYHTFSPDDLAYVTVSTDGGHTFSPPHNITNDPNALNSSSCNTIPGGVVVDQVSPHRGTVYALWLSGNDVTSNVATGCNYSQIGPFNKAWVSVSKDGGDTWSAHLAWRGAFDPASKTGDNADKIFANLAVDAAGQVHVVLPVRHGDDPLGFVAECETNEDCRETPHDTDLLVVTSPDQGKHWTKPLQINRDHGSNFFPWIAAGTKGRMAIAYYRSATQRPNDPSSVWYIGYAQVTGAVAAVSGAGAVYTNPPHVTFATLDSRPMHKGGICSFGIFCSVVPNANRHLADSIAVAIDPGGGANVVWTNDNEGNRQGKTDHIEFACQSSGPSLLAGKPPLNGCYRD